MAGGKSRRMGKDKATIVYRGETLLTHAAKLLTAFGCDDSVILGRAESAAGVVDPLPGAGPAANLQAWINGLVLPVRLVVVPVDMPLLTLKHLDALAENDSGGFFEDLYLPFVATVYNPLLQPLVRMKALLATLQLPAVQADKAWQDALTNFNTSDDLKKLSDG